LAPALAGASGNKAEQNRGQEKEVKVFHISGLFYKDRRKNYKSL